MENWKIDPQQILVDTSEGKPVYLLAVGDRPTYIRLSAIAYYLLSQRSQNASYETLAQNLSQQEKPVSPAQVEAAYQQVIDKIAEIERNPQLNRSSFLWRRTLIPQKIVRIIAHHLSVAFSKPIAYSLLGLIGFSIAIVPSDDVIFAPQSSDWFWGYLLFLISLMLHEFGHASACARYGAEPSDIGFTLYLIWPAFYSDVSAAWKLKRWQRVVVDVGGIFFQLIVAAIYIIIYKYTGWMPVKIGLLLIAGSCLLTLNPVFKFDGYWVVADTLGVTNLSQQPLIIFKHICHRLCGRSVTPLPWSPAIIFILSIYSIISFLIWGYFLWIVIPLFVAALIQYPSLIGELIYQLSHPPIELNSRLWESLLAATFMLFIAGLMSRKICMILAAIARRKLIR